MPPVTYDAQLEASAVGCIDFPVTPCCCRCCGRRFYAGLAKHAISNPDHWWLWIAPPVSLLFLLAASLSRLLCGAPSGLACFCPVWLARLQPARRAPHGAEWALAESSGATAQLIEDATRCALEAEGEARSGAAAQRAGASSDSQYMAQKLMERWKPRADAALQPFGICVGGIFSEIEAPKGDGGSPYYHIIAIFARRSELGAV